MSDILALAEHVASSEPAATRLPSWMQADLDDSRATNITIDGDGGVSVDQPEEDAPDPKPLYLRHDFEENLAEHLTDPELASLANVIQQGIDADHNDRRDWADTAARAVDYLGLRVLADVGGDDGALSKIWDPLMLEATVRFWSNAVAEFLPAAGPAKVRDDAPPPVTAGAPAPPAPPGMGHNGGPTLAMDVPQGPPAVSRDEIAQAFEKDLNHYLTVTDRAYYRDFSRMLFSLGATGTQFRKIYWCPLRGRPVSEWVKAHDLVVSSDATDLSTAARVTQLIKMSQSNAKRLQRSGWWRKCGLMQPIDEQSEVDRSISEAEGVMRQPILPEDHQHTIQECYTELDLPGFEHTDEDGATSGVPLPYRVTLDKDSRQILEIRRNWREDDAMFQARQRFIMFGLIPGLGFYYLGFMHILGNGELTLTSIRRQLLDAGQFANFPGFLVAKGMTKQTNTDIRPEPGQGVEIDTMGKPLRDAVMSLPYTGPSQALMQMGSEMRGDFMSLAGVGENPVGEGTADIPVGTILAMIEQSTKVMAAVHKGLHASRAEELEALRELIAEDPSVLTRYNRKPARQWEQAEEFQDLDLVPSSDPNVPSQMHRIMHAVALIQIATSMPGTFDSHWVAENALRTIGFEVPAEAFAKPAGPPGPPPGPPADPAKMLQAQAQLMNAKTAMQDSQRKAATEAVSSENERQQAATDTASDEAERQSKERIAGMQEETERVRMVAEQAREHASLQQDASDAHADRQTDLYKHHSAQAHADRTLNAQQARQQNGGIMGAPPTKRIF